MDVERAMHDDDLIYRLIDRFIKAAEVYRIHSELIFDSSIGYTMDMLKARDSLRRALTARGVWYKLRSTVRGETTMSTAIESVPVLPVDAIRAMLLADGTVRVDGAVLTRAEALRLAVDIPELLGAWPVYDDEQDFKRLYNVAIERLRRHERATRWEHVLSLFGFHLCALCDRWRGSGGELCRRCRKPVPLPIG